MKMNFMHNSSKEKRVKDEIVQRTNGRTRIVNEARVARIYGIQLLFSESKSCLASIDG